MAARELIVLGTSSQTPTAARNHNGYLVRFDGEAVLFDPGEGTQRQLLRAGVAPSSITAIAITHDHGDHCLGLPGVLARLALDGLERAVPLVFPAGGAARTRALVDVAGPHAARVVEHPVEVGPEPATVLTLPARGGPSGRDGLGGLTLQAAALDHRVPTCGYRLVEPDGVTMDPAALAERGVTGPDVGRLLREGSLTLPGGGAVTLGEVSRPRRGQRVAFVMDTRWCDGASALARDADLLVCEATFTDAEAEVAPRYGHLTARQAGVLARGAGVRRLVLAHFSQRYDDLGDHARQAGEEHDDVVVAHDLDRVEVPPRR